MNNPFLTKKLQLYYFLTNLLHRTFSIQRIRSSLPPQKILLSNWGSLGDVVLSTAVIAEIKSACPDCRIGLIVSEKSKPVCETIAGIDWVHIAKPPALHAQTKWRKWAHFVRYLLIEQPRLAKEIAAIQYDCALELRPFFPNVIPAFWKARIPLRIGFPTSGNGKLLNAPAVWQGGRYLPQCYGPLLAQLGIQPTGLRPQLRVLTRSSRVPEGRYLVFHLCSSDSVKELPLEYWRAVYAQCKAWGWAVYFTGKGERECEVIKQIAQQPSENLCDRLSWSELVQCIEGCSGLVSIDSVPIHIAACFGVRTAALFWRTSSPELWRPEEVTTTSLGIEKQLQVEDVLQVIRGWK